MRRWDALAQPRTPQLHASSTAARYRKPAPVGRTWCPRPQPIGASRRELTVDAIRRWPRRPASHRRAERFPPAHTLHAGVPHEPGDAPAARMEAAPRVARGFAARRTCRATCGESPRSALSTPHWSAPASTAVASATRSTRWGRHPARGTWWLPDGRSAVRSGTRILGRNRIGLPCKPSRGF